jgi:hypothetical protein
MYAVDQSLCGYAEWCNEALQQPLAAKLTLAATKARAEADIFVKIAAVASLEQSLCPRLRSTHADDEKINFETRLFTKCK